MKFPFNPWPLGVVLAFAVFVAGTASLVVLACSHRSDLVRADYYSQEIRHQEQMDRVERTRRAAPEVRVAYQPTRQSVEISLPAAHARSTPNGRIHLYRPSAASLDRTIPLELDAAGCQSLDAAGLAPGLWRVQIAWTVAGEEYYHDQKLIVSAER
jgi:nitrogen fixation protein FixH